MAEREGFEPPDGFNPSTVFKTAAFDHSATSPHQTFSGFLPIIPFYITRLTRRLTPRLLRFALRAIPWMINPAPSKIVDTPATSPLLP